MSRPPPPFRRPLATREERRLTSLTSEEWTDLADAYMRAQPLTPTFEDALRQGREILEFILGPSGPQQPILDVEPPARVAVAR